MNPYEAYQTYVSLKAHFAGKGFNYNLYGKTKTSPKTFDTRKDKYYFEKLSKKYKKEELVEFIISQIVGKGNTWVGNMFSEEALELHRQRMKRVQALQHTIRSEVKNLWHSGGETPESFEKLFSPKGDGSYAPLFQEIIKKTISPETFVVLDDILHFTKNWNTAGDPVWEEIGIPILQYAPFLNLQNRRDELKKIIAEILNRK